MTLKLVAMATSLAPSEKGGQIGIYDQSPTIWWKFGENRSSRSWDLFAQKFIFKNRKRN